MKPDALEYSMRSTAFENCLLPLLKALKWRGNERSLREAMPHYTRMLTVTSFCDVMQHLHFKANAIKVKIATFDNRLLPCLLVTETGDVMVLLAREDDKIRAFNGASNREVLIDAEQLAKSYVKAALYIFKAEQMDSRAPVNPHWYRSILKENKGLVYNAIFLSLIVNLLILATPLFIMSVYDKVIGTSSLTMLNQFGVGVMLAMLGIFVIYRLRSEHLSLIGARCDKAIGDKVVSQLLYLSPTFTETATAGAQVARIKDFDRVREFIAGPFLVVFFELPFIVLALALIAILGGLLVLIPVCMIIIFLVVGVIMAYKIKRGIKESAESFSELQEFLLEAIENIRIIKYTGVVEKWGERYRERSARASMTSIKFSMYNAINLALSEVVMIGSGMLVLAFGAIMAMNGTLNIGAMLAIMILIWRVLAPIKSIFNTLPRILQLFGSMRQIHRLMSLTSESEISARVKLGKYNFKGDITFQRVSMRYPAAYTPSLLGVSSKFKAGELIALVGRNGSGKSTMLKVLLGLYQPQSGGVLIDSKDIRQINPIDLRSSLGYLPQSPELFYGSIAANIRLGDPTATQEDLELVAQQAGILQDIENMPKGFDTQLTDQSTQRMALSFRQCLCLARAYLRQSTILLLDEPANALDNEMDKRLVSHLSELHGKSTVVMVTHRPSHLRLADQIVLLDQGQVVLQGPPTEVLQKIPMDLL